MDDQPLRLMLPEPLTMNMSNTLGYFRGELGKTDQSRGRYLLRRVLDLAPIRRVLLAVHHRIFRWYYS